MLKYGLSVILVFIGVKMLIVDFYHIPVAISLGVVGGILAVTLLINAWVNRQHDKAAQTARVICYRAVGPRWRRGNQL